MYLIINLMISGGMGSICSIPFFLNVLPLAFSRIIIRLYTGLAVSPSMGSFFIGPIKSLNGLCFTTCLAGLRI